MQLANTCTRCPLSKSRTNIVWGDGDPSATVMFIAESPGKLEDKFGYPFVEKAPAGGEFIWLLAGCGWQRGDVYITNMAKCHPPEDRDPTQDEIELCSVWLQQELERVKPRFIVPLGRVATRWFLGDVDMESEHGIPRFDARFNAVIIPAYHPAAGLHQPDLAILVQRDMDVVKGVVEGRIPAYPREDAYPEPDYREITSSNDLYLQEFMDTDVKSATDTEFARGKPWCLSFSIRPGTARVVMGGQGKLIKLVHERMNRKDVLTLGHNFLYDLPVLRQMGVQVANPADTMVMSYLLQDQPQGLKVLAYRHCGMVMRDYMDMVGGATHANAMAYLMVVAGMQWPTPSPIQVWEKGVVRIKQPRDIGKKAAGILRDVASGKVNKDGEVTDPYDRWMSIKRSEGRGMVEAMLGPMWQGDLSDIDRVSAIYYANRDADATLRVYPHLWDRIVADGLEDTFWRDMRAMPMVSDMMTIGMRIDPDHFRNLTGYFRERMAEIQANCQAYFTAAGVAFGDGVLINPNSSMMVQEAVYKPSPKGVGVGRIIGYSERDGTGDDILAKITGDTRVPELARLSVQYVRDFRAMKKLESTYGEALPEHMQLDGRIHTTIRMTRVATGRLSTAQPNLLAIPTRTEDGKQIRNGFLASDGCLIVSTDFSGIEMRVVCHDSGDPVMTEVFRLGLDLHSQTASKMFGIPVEEVDGMKHRYPAKRVGFGVLYGLSAEGLQLQMAASGLSVTDWDVQTCDRLIKEWFKVYKGVAEFMQRTREHAMRFGWVQDMWGRRRYIPHARSRNEGLRAEALRQACNAPIQMGATGVFKQALGDLVPVIERWRGMGAVWNPLLGIHDDLLDEMDKEHLEAMLGEKIRVMEGAVKLSVPVLVDAKVGERWGSLKGWPPKQENGDD